MAQTYKEIVMEIIAEMRRERKSSYHLATIKTRFKKRYMEMHQRKLSPVWHRLVLTAVKKLVAEGNLVCQGRSRFSLPSQVFRQNSHSKASFSTPIAKRNSTLGLITPTSITRSRQFRSKSFSNQETQTWLPDSPQSEIQVGETMYDYPNTPLINEMEAHTPTRQYNESCLRVELLDDSIANPDLAESNFFEDAQPNPHFEVSNPFYPTTGNGIEYRSLLVKIDELETALQENSLETRSKNEELKRLYSSQIQLFNLIAQLKVDFKSEVESSMRKISEFASQVQNQKGEINSLREMIDSLKDELVELETANQVSVAQLAENDELHSNAIQIKVTEIAGLLKEKTQLKSQLEANRIAFQNIAAILKSI
ncbi:hypothetical protein HDV04_002220 [Boothiomyces sp. JEL0838]|nr:hypothetical protein HDV04_002220 [Boothiomyces sp. JEL0838]